MRIGIDFGTTFSLPATVINGRAEALLSGGGYGIPSLFYYDKEMGESVGSAAADNGASFPENVIREIKMKIKEDSRSTYTIEGRSFTKKEIIAKILAGIVVAAKNRMAEKVLADQRIEGAVISIPAAFEMREIDLICEAAKSAGINVLGTIREPNAAAIAFFHRPDKKNEKTILVYDLGGGTCDVSIVQAKGDDQEWFDVVDSDMARIGGRDWDKEMVKILRNKLKAKGAPMSRISEYDLLSEANITKHYLSVNNERRVGFRVDGTNYGCMVNKAEFESATASLLAQTMDMVDRLIRKNKVMIDYVVCVGGGSNMPQVLSAFRDRFPEEKIKLFEPEKSIAYGAAIFAESFSESDEQTESSSYYSEMVHDKCKFSYGVELWGEKKFLRKRKLYVYNYIFKGADLPTQATCRSSKIKSNTTETHLPIYESKKTADKYLPEEGEYIGEIVISGLEKSKKGDETILTMTINQSGLMELFAMDVKSGKTQTAEIRLRGYEE